LWFNTPSYPAISFAQHPMIAAPLELSSTRASSPTSQVQKRLWGQAVCKRLAGLLIDCKKQSHRPLAAQTYHRDCAERFAALSVRDISQSMFADGQIQLSNPDAMAFYGALTEASFGPEVVFRVGVGDILNSLQGKRSKNKHVQALLKLT
jgi:hypothetical protein